MIGSILESLFLGLLALAGFTFLVVVTGGFLLWRYGRRKLRAFRSHGAVIGATAMWDVAASNRWNRSGAAVTPAELQQWTSARVAKEMWRTVDRASAAVRATDELGGPTAELPSLCRRLQAAAVDIDKVLRVDSGGAGPRRTGRSGAGGHAGGRRRPAGRGDLGRRDQRPTDPRADRGRRPRAVAARCRTGLDAHVRASRTAALTAVDRSHGADRDVVLPAHSELGGDGVGQDPEPVVEQPGLDDQRG